MREKSWDLRRRSQREAITSGVVARRAHGALILLLVLMVAAAAPASELEEPCTGESDWMRLTSGEWLKGDLKRMRRRKIEFKSKEMKSLKFDWNKVDRLCTGGVARFINDAHVVFEGKGRVEADYLIVETERGAVRLPRDDLLAILPGRDREIRKWGFTLGAGVDANVGNTNQTAINANMSIRREDRLTRGETAYNGTFGTADGSLNVNRHRLDNNLDWFFSRYLYWSLLDNPWSTINSRTSPSG